MKAPPVALPDSLIDALTHARGAYPSPLADAVARVDACDDLAAQAEAAVLVMRVTVHLLAVTALAVRAALPPAAGERPELPRLLAELARRGHLTEGQWLSVLREATRPWKDRPAPPAPSALVLLLHGADDGPRAALDALLGLRNRLAHEGALTPPWGRSAEDEAPDDVAAPASLEARVAAAFVHLEALLEAQRPLWRAWRFVSPRFDAGGRAALDAVLMGVTPANAGWRLRPTALPDAKNDRPALVGPEGVSVPLGVFVWLGRVRVGGAQAMFLAARRDRDEVVYVTPTTAEQHTERSWKALADALRLNEGPERATLPPGVPPFRGLAPFEEEHRDLFLGRAALVDALRARIEEAPLVVVTGVSGCGKSSLLRAGLLARLREADGAGGAPWRVALCRPYDAPLRELEQCLLAALPEAARGAAEAPLKALLAGAAGADAGPLVDALDGARLLVVVDQAEELFTLLDEAADGAAVRARFASALALLLRVGVVRALLAVRDDHAFALRNLGALREVPRREGDVVEVPIPGAGQLRAILAGMARRGGVRFEEPPEGERGGGAGLLDRMVDGVQGSAAPLVLLQFTADQLWRQREGDVLTLRAHDRIGGVEGALQRYATQVYDPPPDDGTGARVVPPDADEGAESEAQRRRRQALMREYLLLMFAEDGSRHPVARHELPEVDADDGRVALRRLERGRLVVERAARGTSEPTYEPVHESLATQWALLAAWRRDDAEWRRVQRDLAHDAERWTKGDLDGSFLWRGSRLRRLRELQAAGRLLTEPQRRFVAASLAEEEAAARAERAEQQRKARVRNWLALVMLGGVGAVGARSLVDGRANHALTSPRAMPYEADAASPFPGAPMIALPHPSLAALPAQDASAAPPIFQTLRPIEPPVSPSIPSAPGLSGPDLEGGRRVHPGSRRAARGVTGARGLRYIGAVLGAPGAARREDYEAGVVGGLRVYLHELCLVDVHPEVRPVAGFVHVSIVIAAGESPRANHRVSGSSSGTTRCLRDAMARAAFVSGPPGRYELRLAYATQQSVGGSGADLPF